jgi:excisionase family DNA binding protein
MTGQSEYLRARDIARLTGVSIRTARRWISKEILASAKVGGARLVPRRELERLFSPPANLTEDTPNSEEEDSNMKQLRRIRKALSKYTTANACVLGFFIETYLLYALDRLAARIRRNMVDLRCLL